MGMGHFMKCPECLVFQQAKMLLLCRTERTGLWEFAGVVAAVAEEEVSEGLHQHSMCPPLLKSWLAKDIVHVGSSAGGAA